MCLENAQRQTHSKIHAVIGTHSHSQSQAVVWKAAFSVWHWLLSANSTLGASLASFAANPGKEITETHNAVLCSSAKKKTSPLSPQNGLYTNAPWPNTHTQPGIPDFSRKHGSCNKQLLIRSYLLLHITNTCIIQEQNLALQSVTMSLWSYSNG